MSQVMVWWEGIGPRGVMGDESNSFQDVCFTQMVEHHDHQQFVFLIISAVKCVPAKCTSIFFYL